MGAASMEGDSSKKLKVEVPSNPTSGCLSKENEYRMFKRYVLSHVHGRIFHSGPSTEII